MRREKLARKRPNIDPSPCRAWRAASVLAALALGSAVVAAWAHDEGPARVPAENREVSPPADQRQSPLARSYATRQIAGWTVQIRRELLEGQGTTTQHATELLKDQLEAIARDLPSLAVIELRKVQLFLSPEYQGVPPTAEFHPDAGWLRDHGRDPAMAKGVEFTNLRIFDRELIRMPNFVLHELAHAYHDSVLPGGFGNPRIRTAYERARSSGGYDRVERHNGVGQTNTFERAYAMTNPMEYFAETTEAFFERNDFFPFNRGDLERHDPEMCALLRELWHVPAPPARTGSSGASPHLHMTSRKSMSLTTSQP